MFIEGMDIVLINMAKLAGSRLVIFMAHLPYYNTRAPVQEIHALGGGGSGIPQPLVPSHSPRVH